MEWQDWLEKTSGDDPKRGKPNPDHGHPSDIKAGKPNPNSGHPRDIKAGGKEEYNKQRKINAGKKVTHNDVMYDDSFETKQRKLHTIANQSHEVFQHPIAIEHGISKKPNPRALMDEISDKDMETNKKLKSWESWLEKGKLRNLITIPDIYDSEIAHVGGKRDKEPPVINEDIKTHHAATPKKETPKEPSMYPRIIREFDDDDEDPMVYQKKKSWEAWLDKNNAIETDHKEGEKKHEWDGKFSSSTIRDDAKDEKAMDEESDEIMEDAGLEEIEKLKSWESWLEIKKRKNQGAPVVPVTNDKDGNPVKPFPKKEVFTDVNNQNAHQNPAPVINSKTPNTMVRRVNTETGETEKVPFGKYVKGSGDEKTSTKGDKTMSKQLNNKTPAQLKERFDYVTNSPKYQESINRDTELTDEQLEERDAENWQNTPAGQAYHKKQEGKKKRGFKTASWEGWLEKMQGAGDARFGNQHLTGLDQKPVNNEEDEANILPEKDEKHDEKEEKTNNKPYKVLGDER